MTHASPTHDAYLARRHFAGLDGVRAVAILAVIWHHAPHPKDLPIFARGFLGVDLFFVLSGFLIATLLIREKAARGGVSLGNFWMRRALRLVPAYYLMLFSVLAAYLIAKPGAPETAAIVSGFPFYALYLSNWIEPGAPNLGPTWSLATEEQFYLVWPLIESFATPIVAASVWVAALLVNQLVNFGVLDGAIAASFGVGPGEHPEILHTTFTPILLGVGLAHLLNSARGFAAARSVAGFAHAPAVYALALLALVNVPIANISGAPRLVFHLAATLFVASVVLRPASRVVRALDWRPVAFIGMVSYGMYLYHMFALHAARGVAAKLGLPTFPAVFILGAALTIAVSAASYYFIEKRFLDMRGRFRGAPARAHANRAKPAAGE